MKTIASLARIAVSPRWKWSAEDYALYAAISFRFMRRKS